MGGETGDLLDKGRVSRQGRHTKYRTASTNPDWGPKVGGKRDMCRRETTATANGERCLCKNTGCAVSSTILNVSILKLCNF